MALRLSLLPDHSSYRPGDEVSALLEACCEPSRGSPADAAVELASLTASCSGLERVDLSWVSSAYGRTAPPAARDNRYVVRHIFRTKVVTALENVQILPNQQQSLLLRLKLPDALPPSYRGTALKCTYFLEATAKFMAAEASKAPPQSDLPSRSVSVSSELGQQQQSEVGQAAAAAAPEPSRPAAAAAVAAPPAGPKRRVWQEQTIRVPLQVVSPRAPELDRKGSNGWAGSSAFDVEAPIQYRLGDPEFLPMEVQAVEGPINGKAAHSSYEAAMEPSRLPWEQQRDGRQQAQQAAALQPPATPRNNPIAGVDDCGTPQSVYGGGGGGSRLPGGETPFSLAPTLSRRTTLDSTESRMFSPRFQEQAAVRSYNLRIGEHPIMRLSVQGPLEGPLCVGSTLTGTLDFRLSREAALTNQQAPRCVQVVVLLETEETVNDEWAVPGTDPRGVIRRVYDEHVELTPDTLLSHFVFSIPRDAPASFATQLLSLRWVLRFELTAVYRATPAGWLFGGGTKTPEELTWVLPVAVLPLM